MFIGEFKMIKNINIIERFRSIACLSLLTIFVVGYADTLAMDQHGDISAAIKAIGKMSPQEKERLVDSFALQVRGVPPGEMGVCLVIGDSGRPKYDHTLISEEDRERLELYNWIVKEEYAHRFPQLYWIFMDVLFGDVGVGLRLDACDVLTWQLMLNAGLKETFRYIVDDFNVIPNVMPSAAAPLMRGIWDVLRPGGIFVSSFNSPCISIEAAREIDTLFDVFITNDVYSCVQYGYVAAPWGGNMIDPMYYCLRFFVKHPGDKRLERLSLNARKKIYEAGNWEPASSGMTYSRVFECQLVVEELQEKWSFEDLFNMEYKRDHKLTPELLFEYTRSQACAMESDELKQFNVSTPIALRLPDSTGIYLVFIKK
jgi:SAM-dependent methyltransferase